MAFYNWGNRRARLTEAQATDVIRHCLRPDRDAEYARKYHVSRTCIANIRRGRSWWDLREALKASEAANRQQEVG